MKARGTGCPIAGVLDRGEPGAAPLAGGDADVAASAVQRPVRARACQRVCRLAWADGGDQRVNGSSRWLKSQVFWVMPEQVLLSRVPGQPPLSRWIAQIDRKFMF